MIEIVAVAVAVAVEVEVEVVAVVVVVAAVRVVFALLCLVGSEVKSSVRASRKHEDDEDPSLPYLSHDSIP